MLCLLSGLLNGSSLRGGTAILSSASTSRYDFIGAVDGRDVVNDDGTRNRLCAVCIESMSRTDFEIAGSD